MLDRGRVRAALDAKREAFGAYEQRTGQDLQRYSHALDEFAALSVAQVRSRLEARDVRRPGAWPTSERVAGQPVVRPFGVRWNNHVQARQWALSVLQGVATLAVDGSQIAPSYDFSVPVGAVQVGWFENPHDPAGTYTKDLRFEVLAPGELAEPQPQDEGPFPDRLVNLRRFELECQVLAAALRRLSGQQPTPVCFFDGSLILSFAARLSPALQARYVNAVRSLLAASEEARVPVVGYVDTSHATDLVTLLRALTDDTEAAEIDDAALLRRRMAWGDRSEVWVCARDDGLAQRLDPSLDYYGRVGFVYLKTTATNAPARIDFPLWVLDAGQDAGQLEHMLDIVRAECVVGTGYPYAVETADAVAVITVEDREHFYRAYQEFLGELGVPLRYARKAYSKRARR